MIVRLVAHGDLLFPLLAEGFLICVLVRGGGVPHGISVCIMFQSFSQLNQTAHSTPPVNARAVSPSSRLLQEMSGRRSLGSLSLGREKCRSLFFPACFSSARIWATSPASASSWAWVGSCPTCRPNARSRASCGPTLASNRSSRSLLALSSRYRAVSAASTVDGCRDLYAFWDGVLAEALAAETDLVLNLASREYSRAYNRLKARKRRGRITTDEWNQQVAKAQALKDAFTARKLTREEYVQKLDAL